VRFIEQALLATIQQSTQPAGPYDKGTEQRLCCMIVDTHPDHDQRDQRQCGKQEYKTPATSARKSIQIGVP
jgi:hypothetical protein